MLADVDLYDMLDAQDLQNIDEKGTAFTIRSVFIIDPAKKIRLTIMYHMSCGRNTVEILRFINPLQTADKKGITTPIDWQLGDDVTIPPNVSTTDEKKFREYNVREVRPYLRFATL